MQMLKLWPHQLCGPWPAELSTSGATVPAGASCVAVLTHGALVRMASGTFSPVTFARLLEFFVQLVLLPGLGAQGTLDVLSKMAVSKPGEALFVNWCEGRDVQPSVCLYEVWVLDTY